MIYLQNFDEIAAELTDMILDLEVSQNDYDTYVYLYIDEDGKGELTDRLYPVREDDGYILVYLDHSHTGSTFWDLIGLWSEDEICEEFGKSSQEVYQEIASETGEDIADLDRHDLQDYIEECDDYYDKVVEAVKNEIDKFVEDEAYDSLIDALKQKDILIGEEK